MTQMVKEDEQKNHRSIIKIGNNYEKILIFTKISKMLFK